jgi:uncharacterized protein with NAD-binding domain and iron-sulfur cluster
MPDKKQIHVLGGGIGGLTAAYFLTSDPEWRKRYDVTLYQLGWRLGGKCASSRGDRGRRIEEHGLHVWFGFYENAFRMLRECYCELGLPLPLDVQRPMFEPRRTMRMYDPEGSAWTPWDVTFPELAGEPGTSEDEPSVWMVVGNLLVWVYTYVCGRIFELKVAHPLQLTVPFSLELIHDGMAMIGRLAPDPAAHDGGDRQRMEEFVAEFRDAINSIDAAGSPGLLSEVGRLKLVADLALTIVIGICSDGLLTQSFETRDGEEFLAWLRRHGAQPTSLDIARATPLRALYDTCFAFEEGDVTKPNFAAGVALGVALRIALTYRGRVVYTMLAGMGEVVIAPLYDVLDRRGVKFEFFQRVTAIEPDPSNQRIARVQLSRQATVKNGGKYEPLVRDGPLPFWPPRPLFEQLDEGTELQKTGVDLESAWSHFKWDEKPWTLEVRDNDDVVLGISLGALPEIAKKLGDANADWAKLLSELPTIQTQSMQLWLDKTSEELGWKGASTTELPTAVAAPEPHDVWADMSHTLRVESWPQGGPRSVHYLCGPMTYDYLKHASNDPGAPERAWDQVRTTASNWLTAYTGWLLPRAGDPITKAIDWNVLHADPGMIGEDRLYAQWLRPNIDPTERYVLAPAVANLCRLRSDTSGFSNLVLAGDWTRTAINAGCVEAAVMSGMTASRKLCGTPLRIYSEHFMQG